MAKCSPCKGSGLINCPGCNGQGQKDGGFGVGKYECKHCKGSGKKTCPNCKGKGNV